MTMRKNRVTSGKNTHKCALPDVFQLQTSSGQRDFQCFSKKKAGKTLSDNKKLVILHPVSGSYDSAG